MTDSLFYWIGVVVFCAGGALGVAGVVALIVWAATHVCARSLNRAGTLISNLRDLKAWKQAGMPRYDIREGWPVRREDGRSPELAHNE